MHRCRGNHAGRRHSDSSGAETEAGRRARRTRFTTRALIASMPTITSMQAPPNAAHRTCAKHKSVMNVCEHRSLYSVASKMKLTQQRCYEVIYFSQATYSHKLIDKY